MFKKRAILILYIFLLILIIGTSLRFYHLDRESIWTDEAYTLNDIKGSLTSTLNEIMKIEVTPPAYFLMLKVWTHVFGTSEFVIRFISALFGTMSIGLLFLTTKIVFDDKIALYSSFLLSVSMLNILYSQEARTYSLSVFLILLSTYLLLRIVFEKKKKENKFYILFIISTILSIYVSYIGLIPLLIQSTYLFFYQRNKFKGFLKCCLLPITFLCIPLLPTIINQSNRVVPYWRIMFADLGMPLFLSWFGIYLVYFCLGIITILFFVTLSSKYLINLFKKTYNFWTTLLVVCLFSITFILLYGVISHSVFFVRYSFFLLPLFYVYVSYAAVKFNKKCGFLLILILVLLNTFALYTYYTLPQKPQWREAVLFIEGFDLETDVILFDRGEGANRMIYDYYSVDGSVDKIDIATVSNRIPDSDLSSELEKYGFGWLILSKNMDDHYLRFMMENYRLVTSRKLNGISVYLFELE